MIKVGSDFSGVGAFNQALKRLGIEYDELFACDMDKYARQTFELNYGKPKDFPFDVYEREIPKESLDIYMTSPPCQAFSMAGKRLGKEDQRGILFFNSLEFIQENKPRYFIFENVKGLLSHDKQDKNAQYGRTFQEWINYLGGKSVNGVHTFFPIEDSVPYHIYFQVLNAKHYGIPQNRERIFIIGIRDDEDNNFQFPKPVQLTKRLKDVLEPEVDEKYFLSDKMILGLTSKNNQDNGFTFKPKNEENIGNCVTARCFKMGADDNYIETQIGTWRTHEDGKGFRATEDNNCPTIPARAREDGSGQPVIKIGAIRGRNPENPKSRETGLETEQMLEINENGTSNALTTVQKDNVVVYDLTNDFGEQTREYTEYAPPLRSSRSGLATNVEYIGVAVHPNSKKLEFNGFKDENCPTLLATDYKAPKCIQYNTQRIRRLTPRECFNLMDFNQEMIDKTIESKLISDSQLYRQAGNSIAVGVLVAIIKNLKL